MHLEKMKTTDFKKGKKYTFVIPTGSIEQHGPFLPIGTDSFIQEKMVEEVEKKFKDIIFLPTLKITCSEEHEGFAGSIWIQTSTMCAVLKDVCDSIKPYAKQIIFVTAHGGNVDTLKKFAKDNKRTFKKVRLDYIEPFTEEIEKKMTDLISGPLDDHAGNCEISMMLAIDKRLVSIPPKNYPKKVIEHPFKTNRLKDFSEDGVADSHPEWMVSKKLGEEMIKLSVEGFSQQLKKVISK
jgi:creatinine amidohydrolase